MTNPAVVFPDAALVTIDYLNLAMNAPVLPRVPTTRPDQFVVVQRTGGPRRDIVTDQPTLTFDCWAKSDEAAHDLAQQARTLMHAMHGAHGETVVYQVTEVGGPQYLPDPLSDQPRYMFTLQVAMRGLGSGS